VTKVFQIIGCVMVLGAIGDDLSFVQALLLVVGLLFISTSESWR